MSRPAKSGPTSAAELCSGVLEIQTQFVPSIDVKFRMLDGSSVAKEHLGDLTRWLYETRPAEFDFLFGDADLACQNLESWLQRSNSEFSASRATIIIVDDAPAGIMIAIPGSELPACRRADFLTLIKAARGARERRSLRNHAALLADSIPPVDSTEFYLRSLAIDSAYRGIGLGRKLLHEFIQQGVANGSTRFRLEVSPSNTPACALYRSFGFATLRETVLPQLGWRFNSMVLAD